MKYPLYQTEILTDVRRGIYTQTTYYSDGSVEILRVPKGEILIPKPIGDWGSYE